MGGPHEGFSCRLLYLSILDVRRRTRLAVPHSPLVRVSYDTGTNARGASARQIVHPLRQETILNSDLTMITHWEAVGSRKYLFAW